MNQPFEIICLQGDSMTWTDRYHKHASGLYLPGSQPLTAYGGWGNMLLQSVQKQHFGIWSSRYDNRLRRSFEARGDVKLLEFSLHVDGNTSYKAAPFSHQIIKNSQFNIFYLPYMESQACFEAGQLTTTLDIHFGLDYLKEFSRTFPDLINPFLDKAEAGTAVQLFSAPLFATSFMLLLADRILHSLKTGSDNDLLLELDVKTLLSYALSCKYELNLKKRKITLEQISAIYAIRNRLLTDFSSIPRLEDLAREAHMSLPRFKTIFKEVVLEAPYRFWMNNRLNIARDLLLNDNVSLCDIALDLVFPDLPSFSKAFKSRFGHSPGELRNPKNNTN
ncbi:helix-turn-helix transcriptional regulator [Niabella hirudinis]|uniref:helix-turn-helix transcriptional regulator n=1 Tax=Niabella hirudinis TaxID=1285929 RepID=UPI003EC0B08A